MVPLLMKSAAALAAVAGLALTSADDFSQSAYGDELLTSLSEADAVDHALRVFERSDRNGDGALDVDEYTALSVITAELAYLNGFVTIETGDEPGLISLPNTAPSALPQSEQVRVAAVAQHAFYVYAGFDARIEADEFVKAQTTLFKAADRNGNGMLKRNELGVFAQRQAGVAAGA